MANKTFTWQELKNFCNKLTEEYLQQEITWWGEETGGTISGAEQLPEDYILTDYGSEPLSVQEPLKDGEEPIPVSFPKGTPILYAY